MSESQEVKPVSKRRGKVVDTPPAETILPEPVDEVITHYTFENDGAFITFPLSSVYLIKYSSGVCQAKSIHTGALLAILSHEEYEHIKLIV